MTNPAATAYNPELFNYHIARLAPDKVITESIVWCAYCYALPHLALASCNDRSAVDTACRRYFNESMLPSLILGLLDDGYALRVP